MSVKRILGTLLATRMGGRGRRRGGALGTAAMLGGMGRRRRSGMGGKLGLAALGYMAYNAYKDHQSRTAGSSAGGGGATAGSASGSGSGSGIADKVREVVDKLSGDTQGRGSGAAAEPSDREMEEEARAAESLSEGTALLLIRAMVTAAYSDGAMSTAERQRIMDEIEQAGGDQSDRETMEREIANPRPLDELLAQVNDEETAEEFYLASRAAIDGESEADRAYLADLRARLGLSEEQAAEMDEMAT